MNEENNNYEGENSASEHKLSNEPQNSPRRKALQNIAVGGVVASIWHKPIINSVALPAHAQTSADTDTDAGSDSDTDAPVLKDYFATTAEAVEVSSGANRVLEFIVPSAMARVSTNELPLTDLLFEAEAIDQGDGDYKITIAAAEVIADKVSQPASPKFVFGWDGTLSESANANITGTGCAQNEAAVITNVSQNSLTLEMSYFSKTIELKLESGSAALPSFPLTCAS